MRDFVIYVLFVLVIFVVTDMVVDKRQEAKRRAWQESHQDLAPREMDRERERWETRQDMLDPGNQDQWDR